MSLLSPPNRRAVLATSVAAGALVLVAERFAAAADDIVDNITKLIFYNKPPKGGHFAAWEQPRFYSEDVRAGLKPLRKSA